MTPASLTLFQVLWQGPEALAGVPDSIVADRTVLEDFNTALSAFEGNIALEDDLALADVRALHEAAFIFRARLSGKDLSPAMIRPALADLQHGVLHLPEDKRERAWARVRRPLFAASFADLRPALLAILGGRDVALTEEEGRSLDRQLRSDVEHAVAEARFRVLERQMWSRFPGEHVLVRANGEVIAHDRDQETAVGKLVDYQSEHGPTFTWHIEPEGTPKRGPAYLRTVR